MLCLMGEATHRCVGLFWVVSAILGPTSHVVRLDGYPLR